MEYVAKTSPRRCPSHPGEVLADILDDMDISKTAFAKHLGISRTLLYAILSAKKPVTKDTAVLINDALAGNGPGLWLRLQANFDTWHAEQRPAAKAIKPLPQIAYAQAQAAGV
ncbi:MAG: HigA family addiction module antidote protein [Rhizobiaceae bacterium]|nr:HigA family addiction module antidote protein [Rhizobiaceae bacterium]